MSLVGQGAILQGAANKSGVVFLSNTPGGYTIIAAAMMGSPLGIIQDEQTGPDGNDYVAFEDGNGGIYWLINQPGIFNLVSYDPGQNLITDPTVIANLQNGTSIPNQTIDITQSPSPNPSPVNPSSSSSPGGIPMVAWIIIALIIAGIFFNQQSSNQKKKKSYG